MSNYNNGKKKYVWGSYKPQTDEELALHIKLIEMAKENNSYHKANEKFNKRRRNGTR
jgi:hypothetical protein